MSRFKPQERRFSSHLGSSYMGAGRTEASFTFRARPPFAKMKQIYGEHLESTNAHYPSAKNPQKLDAAIRQQIAEKIKKEQRKRIKRQVIFGCIAAITLIISVLYLNKISHFSHFLLK